MQTIARPRLLAALGILLLSIAAPVTASTPLNDAEARVHLEEMQQNGVLRDVYWSQAHWVRALNAPTAAAQISDLRWAVRFDPAFVEARWKLCTKLAHRGDPEFAAQALACLPIALESFLAQQRVAFWIVTILGGAVMGVLVILSAVTLGRALPRVRHGIWERLQFLPPEVRTGATLLTLLLPLVIVLTLPMTAAVFWAVALGTAGSWQLLRSMERRVCVATLAAILVAPVALSLWVRLSDVAYPTSYLRNLWVTQSEGEEQHRLVTAPPTSAQTDPDYWASLALLERRAGRHDEAAARLARAIELAPREWSYYNNLGNLYLLEGDTDGALQAYAAAASLAPDEPIVPVNEAQAYVRRLEFRRADEAFARATALGYRLPEMLSTEPTDIVVRDRTLGAGALWQRFFQGDAFEDVLPAGRVFQMVVAPVLPMQPMWIAIPLFLALYYVLQTRRLAPVNPCVGCGSSICRKCHYRANRKSYCARCYSIRQEIRAPLKREEMLEERRRKTEKLSWATGAVCSVVFPGVGHWMRGAPRRASLHLGAAVALVLIATAGLAWADPSPILARQVPLGRILISAALFSLLALGSFRFYLRPEPIAADSKAIPPELRPRSV